MCCMHEQHDGGEKEESSVGLVGMKRWRQKRRQKTACNTRCLEQETIVWFVFDWFCDGCWLVLRNHGRTRKETRVDGWLDSASDWLDCSKNEIRMSLADLN